MNNTENNPTLKLPKPDTIAFKKLGIKLKLKFDINLES